MELLVYQSPNWFVNLKGNSSSVTTPNQTKSVKSSTVDTSLFLWPVASALPAEVLCCIDLFCWLCPCVTEIPGVGRDWISSWAWAQSLWMNCINTLAAVMSFVLCVFFSFYPGSDPLNVSQSGQPLRSVCIRGVGSILMHQRGHLQGGKSAARTWGAWFSEKEGRSYVCMESHLPD